MVAALTDRIPQLKLRSQAHRYSRVSKSEAFKRPATVKESKMMDLQVCIVAISHIIARAHVRLAARLAPSPQRVTSDSFTKSTQCESHTYYLISTAKNKSPRPVSVNLGGVSFLMLPCHAIQGRSMAPGQLPDASSGSFMTRKIHFDGGFIFSITLTKEYHHS